MFFFILFEENESTQRPKTRKSEKLHKRGFECSYRAVGRVISHDVSDMLHYLPAQSCHVLEVKRLFSNFFSKNGAFLDRIRTVNILAAYKGNIYRDLQLCIEADIWVIWVSSPWALYCVLPVTAIHEFLLPSQFGSRGSCTVGSKTAF